MKRLTTNFVSWRDTDMIRFGLMSKLDTRTTLRRDTTCLSMAWRQRYFRLSYPVLTNGQANAVRLLPLLRRVWRTHRREPPIFARNPRRPFRSYAICVDRQLEIYHGLRDSGIAAAISYAPPIYQYSVYAGKFPQSRRPARDRAPGIPNRQPARHTRIDIRRGRLHD